MTEKKQYKIGYALSGGGAKGFAHAGAIKALEEYEIFPDIIAGTSAGSVVGAFYASGYKPEEICDTFLKMEVNDFIKFSLPRTGLFKSEGFVNFLKENIKQKNIEDLNIPLHIVATDFDHGQSVVFTSGELAPRVMASSSVPIFFKPTEIDGVHYVDGGIFRNFPVTPIRDITEFIIGINVSPLSAHYKESLVFIAEQTYSYMFRANTVHDKQICDVVIEIPEALQYSTFDLKSARSIFDIGYKRMKEALEQIDEETHNYLRKR